MKETCGYVRDCPRQYSLEDVNRSAAQWNPADETATVMLRKRKQRAAATCKHMLHRGIASGTSVRGLAGLRADQGLQENGGWCLDVSRRAHDKYSVAALAHSSYFLPKPFLAADSAIVALLSTLLRRCDDLLCSSWRSYSLSDFGAGIGSYGRSLLDVDKRYRWAGYDAAGNIEDASNGFVRFFDLTIPLSLPRTDWVMSVEVGEHVPPSHEWMVVRNLHAHNCRGIILSWAYLGKTGVGHVNNHSPSYLEELFAALGYRVNAVATEQLRSQRTARSFAEAFRGRKIEGASGNAQLSRWRDKALRARNVSQRWWWIRPTVFERIVPVTGPGCSA